MWEFTTLRCGNMLSVCPHKANRCASAEMAGKGGYFTAENAKTAEVIGGQGVVTEPPLLLNEQPARRVLVMLHNKGWRLLQNPSLATRGSGFEFACPVVTH